MGQGRRGLVGVRRWGGLLLALALMLSWVPVAYAADYWIPESGWDYLLAYCPMGSGWKYGYILINRAGGVDTDGQPFAYKGTMDNIHIEDVTNKIHFQGVTEGVRVQLGVNPIPFLCDFHAPDEAWGSGYTALYGLNWGLDMGMTPYELPFAITPISPVDEETLSEPEDVIFHIETAEYYSCVINGVTVAALDKPVPVGGTVTVPWTTFGWRWRNAVYVEAYTELDRSDAIELDYQFNYEAAGLSGTIQFPQSGYVEKGSRTFSGVIYHYDQTICRIVDPNGAAWDFTPVVLDAERHSFSLTVPVEVSGTYKLLVGTSTLNSVYLTVHLGGIVTPDPEDPGGTDYNIGTFKEMLAGARDLLFSVFGFLPPVFLALIPFGLGLLFLARVLGR